MSDEIQELLETIRMLEKENEELRSHQGSSTSVTEGMISLDRAKKYASHQHYRGTVQEPLVEFEDWSSELPPSPNTK